MEGWRPSGKSACAIFSMTFCRFQSLSERVIEDDDDERQAENRFGAEMRAMGNSIHRDLERDGDLLLDFLGSPARPLRDDGCVVVRDIGIRFNGQVVKRDGAPAEQEHPDRNHDNLVV